MRIGVRHIGQPQSNDATVSAQLPQNRECPHGHQSHTFTWLQQADFTRITGVCRGGDALDAIGMRRCGLVGIRGKQYTQSAPIIIQIASLTV